MSGQPSIAAPEDKLGRDRLELEEAEVRRMNKCKRGCCNVNGRIGGGALRGVAGFAILYLGETYHPDYQRRSENGVAGRCSLRESKNHQLSLHSLDIFERAERSAGGCKCPQL